MPGKIKSGLGGLIGNAGENYVMAELLKRGVIAGLTPRNAPAFDVLAINNDKVVGIRVKTKSEKYDNWQFSAKKDGSIFRSLRKENDFIVMINLTKDHKEMDYFIIPTHIINNTLQRDWKKWLSTPGKHGKAHSPTNPKRSFYYREYKKKLERYRNNWEILWEGGE